MGPPRMIHRLAVPLTARAPSALPTEEADARPLVTSWPAGHPGGCRLRWGSAFRSASDRENAMSEIPSSVKYVVVGAGINGLSTGWHLAMELARRKRGTGNDVIVLGQDRRRRGRLRGSRAVACATST